MAGVRRPDSKQDHPWSETIERLDQVCRAMNPFLFLVAVALVVLNLVYVINLIDWSSLPQPPATPVPAASAASGTAAVTGLKPPPPAPPAALPARNSVAAPGG